MEGLDFRVEGSLKEKQGMQAKKINMEKQKSKPAASKERNWGSLLWLGRKCEKPSEELKGI